MRRAIIALFFGLVMLLNVTSVYAQTARPSARPTSPSPTPAPTDIATPTPEPRSDLTQQTAAVVEPLRKILDDQGINSPWPFSPIKYAIRGAVNSGVPVNTIVLLLLLPGVAAIIAAARHLVGIRGFGILMPAALSVVFVATGPIVGIALFMVIVVSSTFIRFLLRITKVRLQYLPRMSMILLFVVLGVLLVLFLAPVIKYRDIINVSIFPVLFLVLLAEDFTRVQLGKSIKVAMSLTTETLGLALASYLFLTSFAVQSAVLLNPEIYLTGTVLFDFVMGKYVGLRFVEFWRFRKLIRA